MRKYDAQIAKHIHVQADSVSERLWYGQFQGNDSVSDTCVPPTYLELRLIWTSARLPFTVMRKQIGASPFLSSLIFLMKKRIEK